MKPTLEGLLSLGLKHLTKVVMDVIRFSRTSFSKGFISGLHF
jgi:hypothetical protein